MKYLAGGIALVDYVYKYNQSEPEITPGGVPMYGYCGMRLWSSEVSFLTKLGEDYLDIYNPWFTNNNVPADGIEVLKGMPSPYCVIRYNSDSDLSDAMKFMTGDWADAMKYRPDGNTLRQSITAQTKGISLCAPPPLTRPNDLWDTLFELKEKYGFKVIWEPTNMNVSPSDREATEYLLERVDMVSFNRSEGMNIFSCKSEDELIDILRKYPLDFSLLRRGSKGLYILDKENLYDIPAVKLGEVVDVTGCGNASTAAAVTAFCESSDLLMTGIKASISAAYNYLQKGPYPLFDDKTIKDAAQLADKLYAEYKNKPL